MMVFIGQLLYCSS